MTIAQAVDWWATQVDSITGIDNAIGVPDDNLGTNGVQFICFDASAVLTSDSHSQYRDLYTIRGLLIMPRADLKSAIMTLRGMPVSIADKVRADPTMGGYVQTYDQITYQFAPSVQWQGVDAIGYIIDVTGVKIR